MHDPKHECAEALWRGDRLRCSLRGGVLLAGILVAMGAGALRAADPGLRFQSGPGRTALVELFTSEGCSSCPPAEAWLNRLASSPGLWAEFVPLALHVNYWDHLGWRDPWATLEFTDRQRAYARSWKSDTVYTPGLVLNGSEWRTWARPGGIPVGSENTGVLTARSDDGRRWEIEFTPATPRGSMEVSLALLSRELDSDVRAGENRGRRLKHDFVVLGLTTTPMRRDGGRFQAEVSLPAERVTPAGGRALAVWVALAGELAPLQALGGELRRRKP